MGKHIRGISREKTKDIGGTFKIIVCAAIVLAGVIIKFGFSESEIYQKVLKTVNDSIDYKEAAAVIGKAVSGKDNIISVFKEMITPNAQQVYAEIKDEKTTNSEHDKSVSEEIYDSDALKTEEKQLDFTQEEKEIEKLSFEMSEAELSDDTKAEAFVIPPPSNCSYDKVELGFKYAVPVYGKITSPYGYRDHPFGGDAGFHTGIDIAASRGTTVKAFASGTVVQAGTNKVYGNFVLLEHKDGIRSFYGHNSKLNVKKGESVKIGQKIAEVGSTGLSTGPHVHFEVRKGNLRVNPQHYILTENI